jgi:hypothetical protein
MNYTEGSTSSKNASLLGKASLNHRVCMFSVLINYFHVLTPLVGRQFSIIAFFCVNSVSIIVRIGVASVARLSVISVLSVLSVNTGLSLLNLL